MRRVAAMLLAAGLLGAGCASWHATGPDEPVPLPGIGLQAAAILDFVEGKAAALPPGSPEPLVQTCDALRDRYPAVQGLLATGGLGETNRGLVELRVPDLFTDAEARNQAQRLLAAENKDRKALHKLVAQANREQDVNVAAVEEQYASERLRRAGPGALFELPSKGEAFARFSLSDTGQRLGAACRPNAWVRIP